MNRRSFLSSMLKGAIACAILPSAVTYERKWIPLESGLIVPENQFNQLPFYLVKNQLQYNGLVSWMNECHTPFWKEYLGQAERPIKDARRT